MFQSPTVGRVVLVRSNDSAITGAEPNREVPGLVTRVWSDTCINVSVQRDGVGAGSYNVTSVTHEDDEANWPNCSVSWRWMPYQKDQAAKTATSPSDLSFPVGGRVSAVPQEAFDQLK